MLKKVATNKAPAAIGPYSQAVIHNNMLFTSGQIPLDPETMTVVGTNISEQAARVMENLKAVLTEAGTNFENVIKTTCFLYDMNEFAEFNKVYGEYFTLKPTRSCVEVTKLPKNSLVEISVIAQKR